MSATYCYLHLRGPGRDTVALATSLDQTRARWQAEGVTVWGVWSGLFGVASNELLVVAATESDAALPAFTGALDPTVRVQDALRLAPTVRPVSTAPCRRSGLYVFRFFDVRTNDVEEVASLSKQAWETFENTSAYAAEPQGLFREVGATRDPGRMLLVTWYDGLESWQTSRRPAPEATANFQRRRSLTLGTLALATTLVT
ncbi:MAG: hypothetical protein PVF57_14055 [Pseudomonadales bacterium]|jgi:hypothetical protein